MTGRVVTVQKIKQIKLFGKLFNGISLEFYSKQSSENLGPKMWSDESLLVNDQIDHPYKEKKTYQWLIYLHYFYVLEPTRANASISESMQPFDNVILDFMTEQDIPGASVALSRQGNLLYCQGKWKSVYDSNVSTQLPLRY